MRGAWMLLAVPAAFAQPAEAPPSTRCTQALDALRANEAQLPASSATSRDALARHAALRRQAARECLGGPGTAVPPRSPRAPVVVPSVSLPPRPDAPSAPPGRPPVLPPSAGAPLVITGCDAAGCWTSDGNYMHRAGAGLFGPRGLCSVRGSTLTCP